jgi:hypothetical protein
VRWHRAGFRLYWKWISCNPTALGRKRVSKELRELIFRMVAENPTWGAPRIHGELLKLGFDLSERTVSRWVGKAPKDPESARRWQAFLQNHREVIAAMDFFTVPTLTFGVLYCFFVIAHDRRRILHINVTRDPPWSRKRHAQFSTDCEARAYRADRFFPAARWLASSLRSRCVDAEHSRVAFEEMQTCTHRASQDSIPCRCFPV